MTNNNKNIKNKTIFYGEQIQKRFYNFFMRNKIIIFAIFYILLCNIFAIPTSSCSYSCYAQILYNDVNFYKIANDDNSLSNIYFIIPQTYFINIYKKEGEYYYGEYNGYYGYVKYNMVTFISNTPTISSVTNYSFRIYGNDSQKMYSVPSSTDDSSVLLMEFDIYSDDFIYIASTYGEELISDRTNIWYFCKYTLTNTSGYIYSDMCDKLDSIKPITDTFDYITEPTFLSTNTNLTLNTTNNKIIALLFIPAVIFLILLLSSEKILTHSNKNKNTNTKIKEIKEIKDF